ncbi:hypothetical protein AVEN_41070-1 [Araneus ventricosus]|uniref:Uncharacterized protein n=1 Tax=Araneus ventricosus TaxID=182803 RepID=A0A4Y2CLS3_ARAVE|nr:hypothetical protein AVEN_41070-1 [Araneus ventricosus]
MHSLWYLARFEKIVYFAYGRIATMISSLINCAKLLPSLRLMLFSYEADDIRLGLAVSSTWLYTSPSCWDHFRFDMKRGLGAEIHMQIFVMDFSTRRPTG